MSFKLFPKKEGWIRAKLTITRGCTITEEEVKNFLSMGKPERNEWGSIDTESRPVVAFFREIKKPSESVAQAE